MRAETTRILEVYKHRSEGDYSFSNLWSLQIAQRREFLLARMLCNAGIRSLAGSRILDVGCGDGRLLRLFAQWGAAPGHLFGCDINPGRLDLARDLQPGADFQQIDGHRLPYEGAYFDIVCQFTVFSSILSSAMRVSLADEMRRAVRPGGVIVWFDFRYNNPWNRNVRGVGKQEIKELFPSTTLTIASLGLLPPVARRVAACSSTLAAVLERFPPLRYAYLAVIHTKGSAT
jgi:SAM-dependent methyltransferase